MTVSAGPVTWSEVDRQAALDRYAVLDTPPEAAFDELVRLAADFLGAPIAAVHLIDRDRQWAKAEIGLGLNEMPRERSFCTHAVAQSASMVVPDATTDIRFATSPLVTGEPGIRFYAGELLATPDGLPLGTLCVIDTKPRPEGLTAQQRYVLRALARQVMTQLELGRALAQRAAVLALTDALRDLDDIADMALAAAKAMGRVLGASRAGYGEFDAQQETISIRRYWSASGLGTTGGRYHLRDHGSYIDELKSGSMVMVADAERDPRTAASAAALRALGIRAFLNVPVMERGVLVASFFVSCDTARAWQPEEISFARDVADRTRGAIARSLAENELRRLNATLAEEVAARTRERDRVWQVSRDMIGVADSRGVWVSVNPAWTGVLGWSEGEIVGQTLAWLEHPDDAMAAENRRAEVIATRRTRMFENRLRTQAGDYHWLSWIAEYFEGFFYCVARDITADKAQAAALAAAAEQLRQSQKMEAVGQLTGGIAHDFNNLLTGIVGSLELMQTRILQGRTGDLARYVGAAQGAAQRAAALTHRLLAFSRRQTLDPKAVAANRLIAEMEEMVSRTVGPAIRLDVIRAPHLWMTRCDPNQLENALLNLCINARDAMPDGGTLTVETANMAFGDEAARVRDLVPGDYVAIGVADTGTGMAADIVARAFDPFFTTKPLGLGTGLGLSMVYGFARQSGGQVRISSAPGQGTCVQLFLPRCDAEVEAAPAAELATTPHAATNQTVLVVDDEPTVRMLVGEVLGEYGFGAIEAMDGASALRILESNVGLDLLLTDVGLPGGMNGRQLADAARVLRPELKVLFMTGYAETAAFGDGVVAPGMAVITKPFAMEALGTRIMAILKG